MNRIRRVIRGLGLVTLFALPLAVAVGSEGCSRGATACDLQCECTKCNDRNRDECVIEINAAFDEAAAYDCSPEADAAYECFLDKFDCDEKTNTIDMKAEDCEDEQKDLNECLADGTDLGKQTTSPPGDCCSCTCGDSYSMGSIPAGGNSCSDICDAVCAAHEGVNQSGSSSC